MSEKSTSGLEATRPAFERWILTQPTTSTPAYLRLSTLSGTDYDWPDVEMMWRAWCAAKNSPPVPNPSHVHCQCCVEPQCPGVQMREALPADGPTPEQVRRIRIEGRTEALELITSISAETFADKYMGDHQIADTGDYELNWNTDSLRELFEIANSTESVIERLEGAYWTQQAYIDNLMVQLSEEWLPIGAADGDKDGRYILAWFEDRPRMLKTDDTPEPWVAAVRWSGSESQGWGMLGVAGLMPSRFRRISGPDGKPVGFIRDARQNPGGAR